MPPLAEGEVPYARFGFPPAPARGAFPWFLALSRFYFRVRSRGHENIPAEGPALDTANARRVRIVAKFFGIMAGGIEGIEVTAAGHQTHRSDPS